MSHPPPSPSPSDPHSPLSRTARLAHFLTGGPGRRAPRTATSFLALARERRGVSLARDAWDRQRRASRAAHDAERGRMPGGGELLRWWEGEVDRDGSVRPGGGSGGGDGEGRTAAGTGAAAARTESVAGEEEDGTTDSSGGISAREPPAGEETRAEAASSQGGAPTG